MIEVLGGEGEPAAPDAPLPDELPVLPLRDSVTFPDTLTPLAVGQDRSVRLVNDVLVGDRMLVMLASKEPDVDAPSPEQLYDVGVAGTVARMLKVPTARCGSSSRAASGCGSRSGWGPPRTSPRASRSCPTSSRRARS